MSQKAVSIAAASIAFTSVLLGTVHILRAEPPPSFAPGETLSAAKMNSSFAALATRLDVLEKANAVRDAVPQTPSGAIVAYGGASAPEGWILCDGAALDRVGEPTLFSAIGTSWGAPDDSKFNVPDLRGRFLRGVDAKASRDSDAANRTAINPGGNTGDAVGTLEGDLLGQHTHSLTFFRIDKMFLGNTQIDFAFIDGNGPGALATSAAGGAETRPKNANVVYIIKR